MWTPARLAGIGDAPLAASCVPSPGEYNNDRVICGGITFSNTQMALTWPGAAVVNNVPTVVNTLTDSVFPVAFPLFGVEPGQNTKYSPAAIAATPNQAKYTGMPTGPATLVSPMPSITPVKPEQVGDAAGSTLCGVNRFAADNPMLAVGLAVGLFFLLRGK